MGVACSVDDSDNREAFLSNDCWHDEPDDARCAGRAGRRNEHARQATRRRGGGTGAADAHVARHRQRATVDQVAAVGDLQVVADTAAAAVLHYFRNELQRETVTLSEFTAALEMALRGLGLNVVCDPPQAADP